MQQSDADGDDRNTALKQRLEVLFLKFIIQLSTLKLFKILFDPK